MLFYCINCFGVEVFLELFATDILQLNATVQKEELIKLLPICVPNQFELLREISLEIIDDLFGPAISFYPYEGIK